MHNKVMKECKIHGLTSFIKSKSSRCFRCQKCRSECVSSWRKRLKLKLVEEFGGKCQICGYNKCQQVLQFHHKDRSTKKFGIASYGNAKAYESSREEAKKCILLCANCHTEVENGVTIIPCAMGV